MLFKQRTLTVLLILPRSCKVFTNTDKAIVGFGAKKLISELLNRRIACFVRIIIDDDNHSLIIVIIIER